MNARAVVLASTAALALGAPLAACQRPARVPARQAEAKAQAQSGAAAPDPGYRDPPQVSGVAAAADGGVSLSGRALPSSQVRMISPTGARVETRADGQGAWTAPIGPVSEPSLYRLAEEAGGERVEAEGLVAVLPGAPTVALLRAGFGAEVVGPVGKTPVEILAVDYDAAGGAVVSGRAKAASPVRVLVDGQPAIEGAADGHGRFSLTLPKPLPPGRHSLQAITPQGAAETEVAVTPPAPPKDAQYVAQAQPYGWRVDWITPGGGAQTTLLPGAAAPANPPPAGSSAAALPAAG
ncbi:MAG TPA: hypothetical protein VGM25_15865 [Caulobacteraceae bacterium]|jgi:hypothetical protein